MDLPPLALGAVIAAIIAGAISLVGLIVGKELKTSEFRQQWIDALRSDISKLIATSTTIVNLVRTKKQIYDATGADNGEKKARLEIAEQFMTGIKEEMIEGEDAYHRILLRINPEEHVSFINALEDLRRVVEGNSVATREVMNVVERALIRESQLLLKREWMRVKRGEPIFIAAKWVSMALIVVGLLLHFSEGT